VPSLSCALTAALTSTVVDPTPYVADFIEIPVGILIMMKTRHLLRLP